MAVVAPVTENQVRAQPAPGQRVQAAEFDTGQTIGRAAAQLGQAGADFAEQQNTLNIRYAQTAAQRARTEALRRVGEIRSRVTQVPLLDAEAARQQGETEIDTIRRDSAAALEDPLARKMFEDSFSSAVAPDLLRMREHSDQQIRLARNAEAESAVDLATERAVALRQDPAAVATELATIDHNIEVRYQGAPPAAIERARQVARSTVHRQTALAILAADEAGGGIDAMHYYREHATEITASDELALFQAIQPQFDSDRVDAAFGEVISSATPAGPPTTLAGPPPSTPDEAPAFHSSAEAVEPRTVSGREYSPTGHTGRVTEHPEGHQRRSGRLAVDYAAPAGTPIRPPVSGVVVSAPETSAGQ